MTRPRESNREESTAEKLARAFCELTDSDQSLFICKVAEFAPLSLRERFRRKFVVDETTGCWVWTGYKSAQGYGTIGLFDKGFPPRTFLAHRVSYEIAHGRHIAIGKDIDHLCRNRMCVNPTHLEEVTHRENCLRGVAPTVIAHHTNTCKRGHSLHDAIVRRDGTRCCRTCRNMTNRRRATDLSGRV